MTKITFINNQAPSLNATNLNQLQTNVENAIEESANALSTQAIYCKTSADNSMTSSYTDISNWSIVYNIGTAFELNGGKVKVGSNVNHVKIYVKYELDITTAGTFYSYIRKNSNNLTGSWIINKTPTGNYELTNFTMIEVQENDVLTASHYFSASGNDLRGAETTILVEKID